MVPPRRSEAVDAPATAAAGGALGGVLRPAAVWIDLAAVERNLGRLRQRLAPARILAVLKADAYGHGAPWVARTLERAGVDWMGVALVEEGVELRHHGICRPILVLGTSREEQLPLYRRYGLTPTVASREQLTMWRSWTASGDRPIDIHLKIDTGMARLGVPATETAAVLAEVRRSPGLRLTGVLSHLADADDPASPRNERQEEIFAASLEELTEAERGTVLVHLANSAAALARPASRHSLVRLGLALHGVGPAPDRREDLEPVMSVVSRLVLVREVEAGARPGYGGRWEAPRPSRVGVVPIGYADGYAWRLGNRAEVLVEGQRAPVVGAVSMDMTLVDLTETGGDVGAEVVLLGRRDDGEVTAWELAERIGTIPYEVLCLLGLRLPRRFHRGGREVAWESRFARDGGSAP